MEQMKKLSVLILLTPLIIFTVIGRWEALAGYTLGYLATIFFAAIREKERELSSLEK
jgi:Na+/H+-translocating membrane pyrophosphatase